MLITQTCPFLALQPFSCSIIMPHLLYESQELDSRNEGHGLGLSKTYDHVRDSINKKSDLSLVQKAMKGRLQQLEIENGSLEEGDSFFVVDLGYVHRQYASWTQRIPRALPCYGILIPCSSLLVWKFLGVSFPWLISLLSRQMQPRPSDDKLSCIVGSRF